MTLHRRPAVGDRGSGRRALVRLVAYIADVELHALDDNGGTDPAAAWRDALRAAVLAAGTGPRRVLLAVANASRLAPAAWDDLNWLLVTGHVRSLGGGGGDGGGSGGGGAPSRPPGDRACPQVPGLLSGDGDAAIVDAATAAAAEPAGATDGAAQSPPRAVAFMRRASRRLHLALSFSSQDPEWQGCVRAYPALLRTCTVGASRVVRMQRRVRVASLARSFVALGQIGSTRGRRRR